MEKDQQEYIKRLEKENAFLKSLLKQQGISWEIEKTGTESEKARKEPKSMGGSSQKENERPLLDCMLNTEEKLDLFASLFRGRNMYAKRWFSEKTGKTGYSPACKNDGIYGICKKGKMKCADCKERELLPLTKQVLSQHLRGNITIGVYPLLDDNTCHFLACDFDEASWADDAKAYCTTCLELAIPAYLEISRSGKGAHAWIFFAEPVLASQARQLGFFVISKTCERIRQLSLSSYDRFFPNQDILPSGGFGNLIALPLQKHPRELNRSVFVDLDLQPYPDQWQLLVSVKKMELRELEACLDSVGAGKTTVDIPLVEEEENETGKGEREKTGITRENRRSGAGLKKEKVEEVPEKPWERHFVNTQLLQGVLPSQLTLVLSNMIFIEKKELSQQLLNRLIRLAAFQNPEFFRAQALRLSVWNKPRIIGCAENYQAYIGLPRGCLEAVETLLKANGIKRVIEDKRVGGNPIKVSFSGTLYPEQEKACKAMLCHDCGILHAPTASGKTIIAAAILARRETSTLILVHRTDLLKQWEERLKSFLEPIQGNLGVIGGGKRKPSYKIDIAVMQSLAKRENLEELLDHYGQIIIDECHHLGAYSFESILKQSKAKYMLGLTATPIRRDGRYPIVTMQLGPIRHVVPASDKKEMHMLVFPSFHAVPAIPEGTSIQDVFKLLANDSERNERIIEDVKRAYRENRNILVLSERTDHLLCLAEAIMTAVPSCFVLHGRMTQKSRKIVLEQFDKAEGARVLLSTGRLIGEGFDKPILDTLFLALPISWKGTLAQYAGRLNREYPGKTEVRIHDYVDKGNKQLQGMFKKRQAGYKALGYSVVSQEKCTLFDNTD